LLSNHDKPDRFRQSKIIILHIRLAEYAKPSTVRPMNYVQRVSRIFSQVGKSVMIAT
jgi:hypothetical protein